MLKEIQPADKDLVDGPRVEGLEDPVDVHREMSKPVCMTMVPPEALPVNTFAKTTPAPVIIPQTVGNLQCSPGSDRAEQGGLGGIFTASRRGRTRSTDYRGTDVVSHAKVSNVPLARF